MAKEILKDELLSEDQLENVAGGNAADTASDSQFLRDIGIDGAEGFGGYFTKNNFDKVSGIVIKGWAAVGITCTPSLDGNNTYMDEDGKEITRLQAYLHAAEVKEAKIRLTAYGFNSNNPAKC